MSEPRWWVVVTDVEREHWPSAPEVSDYATAEEAFGAAADAEQGFGSYDVKVVSTSGSASSSGSGASSGSLLMWPPLPVEALP